MATLIALGCVASLLAFSVLGAGWCRLATTSLVYLLCLLACVTGSINGAVAVVSVPPPAGVELPLGLPWLGAHFRIDALSGFFSP